MNSELVSIRRLMSPLNTPMPTSALLHDPSAARRSDLVSPFACIFMAFSPCRSDFGLASSRAPLDHAWRAGGLFPGDFLESHSSSGICTGREGRRPWAPPACRCLRGDGDRCRPLLDDDVVAGAAVEDVLAVAADQHVVAVAATESVVAGAADQDVVAVAAVGGELNGVCPEPLRCDDVVAVEPIDGEPVVGGFEPGDVHRGGKTEDRDPVGVTDDLDHIVAGSPVNGDRVRRAIPRAGGSLEVDMDLDHVRPAQVADVNGVGAALCIEVDALDVVEVHPDTGDVAGEEHPPAVGRDVDVLGYVGAVEQQRVEAVLTFEGVVVVTRVPDERVVTRAHEGEVVAVVAVEQVAAFAADEDVFAETAVHRQLDAVRLQA